MSFVASTLHPMRQRGAEDAFRSMKQAEQRLGGRAWALDDYSVADIHLFRLFWRFWNTEHPEREEFPQLASHYDRVRARPAVKRTLEIEAEIGFQVRGLKLR